MRDLALLITGFVLLLLPHETSFAQDESPVNNTIPTLESALDVLIELDLRDAFFNGARPEAVGVLGSQAPLGNNLESGLLQLTDPDGDRVWTASVRFKAGQDAHIGFRFAFLIEDRWIKEAMPGDSRHAALLDDSDETQRIAMVYSPLEGVQPGANSKGLVDDYGAIVEQLGASGPASPYVYYQATGLLKAGDLPAAAVAYNTFKQHQPEEVESDEYPFLYTQVLETQANINAALAFARNEERAETSEARKARLAILIAQIHRRNGDFAAARDEYQRILNTYPNQEETVNGAGFYHAVSYFDEGDSFNGTILLEEWVFADENVPRKILATYRPLAMNAGSGSA